MLPPDVLELWYDGVPVTRRVLRALPLSGGNWECLVVDSHEQLIYVYIA